MPHVNFRLTMAERFWMKVEKTASCWNWTAATSGGYGRFADRGRRHVQAHRWAYENTKGPIPPGLQIDHLCRNRLCVNPDHLEVVTGHENHLRRAATITHCPRNHPYNETNTRVNAKGARECRECERLRSQRRRAKGADA